MKWLVREFNFVAGRYTGAYYDWSSFASIVFVDSELGNDSTGLGTEASPWKTLTKAHNDSGTVTGTVIVINGIFTENLSISKQLRIIGCGGGRNGKAIFNYDGVNNPIRYSNNLINHSLENVETINYTTAIEFIRYGGNTSLSIIGFANCILSNIGFKEINVTANSTNFTLNFRFCVLKECNFNFGRLDASVRFNVGSNNTLFDCTKTGSSFSRVHIGSNNHINNTMQHVVDGVNNIVNTNGQYFSPANNDFNFPDTSPLYLTGTVDGITGIPNNVGAGRLGDFLNPSKYQYTIGGGAVFTNTEIDGTDIYRTDDTIDGRFRTGIVDMGQIRRGVVIGINNTFQFTGGKLTKLIQETNGLTVRQGLDWKLIYGNSINEIQTKIAANEWLFMEYGKMVTVTISLGITYGNADASFDPTDFIIPSFRMFVVEMRFKNA